MTLLILSTLCSSLNGGVCGVFVCVRVCVCLCRGDIGASLLESVCSSYAFVLVLSPRLFESAWCARELREALRCKVPVVLIHKEGSTWALNEKTHVFPPAQVQQLWPPECSAAFNGPKAVPHVGAFYQRFIQMLVRRLDAAKAAGLGRPITPRERAEEEGDATAAKQNKNKKGRASIDEDTSSSAAASVGVKTESSNANKRMSQASERKVEATQLQPPPGRRGGPAETAQGCHPEAAEGHRVRVGRGSLGCGRDQER